MMRRLGHTSRTLDCFSQIMSNRQSNFYTECYDSMGLELFKTIKAIRYLKFYCSSRWYPTTRLHRNTQMVQVPWRFPHLLASLLWDESCVATYREFDPVAPDVDLGHFDYACNHTNI